MSSRRALWAATSARGGIATFVSTISDTSFWDDWNVRFISTHSNGTVVSRASRFAVALALFITELVVRRPDVVHLNAASYGSFVRKSVLGWISKAFGVPVVLHMHAADFVPYFEGANRPYKSMIRSTLERMDASVALGEAWADSLRVIAPRARIVVIPNAIRPMNAVDQYVEDGVNVTFIGEIGERKGVFTLIDAWAKVVSNAVATTPARLTIAGDGDVEGARNRVTRLGLDQSIMVRDWMPSSEVARLLDKTQILVLPSREEGQPMAILEAMARGICVVASEVGGIPEMLDDDCGVLVRPDDGDQLAAVIADVIDNTATRASLGANALRRIHDHFDIDVVSRRFDDLYREILV